MKFVKKFTAIFAAILVTVCLAVFAVACEDNNGDNNGDGNNNNVVDGNGGNNNNNNNNDQYATDTFTVIVKYEDGTPVNGTKKSDEESWMHDLIPGMATNAQVQFCAVMPSGELGSCNIPVNIGEDGTAIIELAGILSTAEAMNTNLFELHIKNVRSYGFTDGENNGAYGRFETDKIPLTIEVTLKLASEVE